MLRCICAVQYGGHFASYTPICGPRVQGKSCKQGHSCNTIIQYNIPHSHSQAFMHEASYAQRYSCNHTSKIQLEYDLGYDQATPMHCTKHS